MAWLVEQTALALNPFRGGEGRKTAFERCKSKKAKTMGLKFGEAVLWKRKAGGGPSGKLSSLRSDCVH